jgi:acyl-CoA dehydrogenase
MEKAVAAHDQKLAAVAEAMGAGCLPGPWLATVWGAALVAAAGEERHAELLGAVAEGRASLAVGLLEETASWDIEAVGLPAVPDNGGLSLSGSKLFVDGAMAASTLLIAARDGGELVLVLVPREAPGVTVVPAPAIDLTRPIARVDLAAVRVDGAAERAAGAAAQGDRVDGDVLDPQRAGVLRTTQLRPAVQVVLGSGDRREVLRCDDILEEPSSSVGSRDRGSVLRRGGGPSEAASLRLE